MIASPSIPASHAQDFFVVGSGGVRLRLYRMRGGERHRRVVIMGHCNGFAAGAYLPLLERLTDAADVFAFDHRGHGGADAPPAADPGSFAPDGLAQDVGAVVAAVAAQRPDGELHYFGHSLSAAAMLRLGIAFPRAYADLPLRAVALMEPPVFPDASHPLFQRCTADTDELVARTRRRRTRWPDAAAFMTGLRRYPTFSAFAPGMLEAMAAATLRPVDDGVALICDPAAEAAIFATWGRPILYPGLDRVPTTHRLHLLGADPAAPGADWVARMMASVAPRLQGVRFEVFAGRGHLWPFEAPDEARAWIVSTLLAC
ncbi:MAG: alpha/beta hydrolase [Alphaproteobacteria bacterium]|nr:alpha/beta hydrolase [Alphaproteobacteria bacterium]